MPRKKQKIITVFGGSGFLGIYLVRELAQRGHIVNIVSRSPDRALHLKTNGPTGQIVLTKGDITDDESVARAVANADAVVDLVGILYEKGRQRFQAIHTVGAEHLAKAAKKAGAQQFIYVSALGIAQAASSRYARTKLAGEQAVQAAFPGAIILRPSVMFGPEDNFFNQFANLFRFAPFAPLIGGGKTRMQPVYVGDVAKAIGEVLDHPVDGNLFELGGAKIYTLKEIFEYILREIGRKREFLNVPFWCASLKAGFLELLPVPPLTRDQVKLLHTDNVVEKDAPGFRQLGIKPVAMEEIVPAYLVRYRKQ